jgi:acyl-CoA synthetase (NDP forming)
MITSSQLRAFFEPRSFALIGASDKSTFSRLIHENLVAAGHAERTYLVNRRATEVHGRPTHPSCVAIGEPVDLAIIMVPGQFAIDAMRDAAAAGALGVTVLSSGFAESGGEGKALQRQLVEAAEELGIIALGPNVLGFVNVAAGVPAMALSDPPSIPGNVALVSQSGASCGAMKDFAALSGVGLSHVITVGNESMVTVGHLIDYLVDEPQTDAIAVFMEGIREPEVFAAAARRAAEAGKALVVLKAGKSELAAKSATAHTGALVGDNRVIDAVFERHGIIRVDTIEDLLVTAGVAAHTGPLDRPGLGVVSISGGACDIVADLAQDAGAVLPELSGLTAKRLAAVMPSYGHVQNPLDVTGAAIIEPAIFTEAVAALGNDPEIGAVMVINSLPWRDDGQPFYGQRYVDAIGAGMTESAVPALYVTQVTQPIGAGTRDVLDASGVAHVVPGLRLAVDALSRIATWSRRRAQVAVEPPPPIVPPRSVERRPYSEVDARSLLAAAGVPVVPGRHVHSALEAVQAAQYFGGPVAMKIVSPDITHKTDLGCVRLGVTSHDAGTVYDEITTAAAQPAAQGAHIDGVLVSPMRPPGVELLVGVTRDPDWGLVVAVALGGVLVEVLDDVAPAPLPVTPAGAQRMLEGLRGAALLRGVRGRPAANFDALASIVVAVGRLAQELEPDLESLEINPLLVDGPRAEALDALVVWRTDGAETC